MTRILVTGAAGFIGSHLSHRLLARGDEVIGLDNMNTYYDVRVKEARLARLQVVQGFTFVKGDIADRAVVERLFGEARFTAVVNLAAQAGVRYSLTNPHAYIEANLVGFLNILEGCRHSHQKHLVYASSSSVYGANRRLPFSVHDETNHPVSLYAATKRANELMAHTYSHLYRLPTTGLRFFTVYGPWGRPDMMMWLFADAILAGRPIDVFNNGHMRRDFTYIDDIVEGVIRVLDHPAEPDPAWKGEAPNAATSNAPYRLYNIGNHAPVELMHVIGLFERRLGRKATMRMLDMQPGDVPETYADIEDLHRDFGFAPSTSIETGVERFADWFLDYRSRGA
jgi:UDP-glucuronate 4-epimerase